MAEVFIAAALEDDAQARGLAEALGKMGFTAGAGAPAEADIAKLVEEAKCVIGLWTAAAPSASVAMLAALAHERKKLVSAELAPGTTPALFQAAARIELAARDRNAFKTRFQALLAEIEKLSSTKAEAAALPEALTLARAALLRPAVGARRGPWTTLGLFAFAVAGLFLLGFTVGRVVNAVRSGELVLAAPRMEAAATPTAAPAAAPTLTAAQLERRPWREVAAEIDEADAAQIKERASAGDAEAQTLACLGHMAGAAGFLPSPTAAREQCDAAAEQHAPAALYLSWVLHRSAPHAGVGAATAQARLAEAARLGWTSAQIEYALTLPQDRASQTEAGRLWLAAAESGDPLGQFHYARWLRDSPAGPRDPAAAIPFLERAAASNQVDALHMLATFHRDGIGVARDRNRARSLYERAAERDHAPSMFNLADMLRGGGGEDRARAVALYGELACMRDQREIQPLAQQRLRALQESAACR